MKLEAAHVEHLVVSLIRQMGVPESVNLTPTTDLLDEDFYDSLYIEELVVQLQGEFNIEIPESDLTESNFGTVADIVAYITRGTR